MAQLQEEASYQNKDTAGACLQHDRVSDVNNITRRIPVCTRVETVGSSTNDRRVTIDGFMRS